MACGSTVFCKWRLLWKHYRCCCSCRHCHKGKCDRLCESLSSSPLIFRNKENSSCHLIFLTFHIIFKMPTASCYAFQAELLAGCPVCLLDGIQVLHALQEYSVEGHLQRQAFGAANFMHIMHQVWICVGGTSVWWHMANGFMCLDFCCFQKAWNKASQTVIDTSLCSTVVSQGVSNKSWHLLLGK